MADPQVTFPDPRAAVLRVVREVVRPALDLAPADLRVGTLLPEKRKQEHQGLPYLMAAQDSATVWRNAIATVNIRLTLWDEDEFLGLQLLGAIRAVLVAYPGDAELTFLGRASFPFPATDPDTLTPMASFNLDVRLAPTVLAP